MGRGRTPRTIHTGLVRGLRRAAFGPLLVCSVLAHGSAAVAAPSLALQAACPPPAPGQVGCLSEILVNARTDEPVVAATGSEPPGVAAPQAGSPAFLQAAYDLAGLSATAGTGDTVAVVDAYGDSNAEADMAHYRATFGLPACTSASGCFQRVDENGGTNYPADPTGSNAGWITETSLDIEAVSALCPHCSILLVQAATSGSSDMFAAEATAARLGAKQISNSWGGSEFSGESSLQSTFTFSGVAVVASAGDAGYGDTEWPSALPTVTAAGGTSVTASGTSRGFSESAWSGAGSGCSPYVAKPGWQTDNACARRMISDISADADPETGLLGYDSYDGSFLAGGTSLAAPLVAAYYALVGGGAGVGSAAWDYARAPLLNDPVGGASGSCATSYLCQGVIGYDGPTGIGSPSGDVVAGTPGIGGAYATQIGDTSATLAGGAYANQLDTTVWWEYGTTNGYGQSTTPVDLGSGAGAQPTASALTGLPPYTTYHFRLVAQNADGVTYGPDGTFTSSVPSSGLASGSGSGAGAQTGGGGTGGGSTTVGGQSSSGADGGPSASDPGGSTDTGSVSSPVNGSQPVSLPAPPRVGRLPVLRVRLGAHAAWVLLGCTQRCAGKLVLRNAAGTTLGHINLNLRGRRWVLIPVSSRTRQTLARTAGTRTVTLQLIAGGTVTAAAVTHLSR